MRVLSHRICRIAAAIARQQTPRATMRICLPTSSSWKTKQAELDPSNERSPARHILTFLVLRTKRPKGFTAGETQFLGSYAVWDEMENEKIEPDRRSDHLAHIWLYDGSEFSFNSEKLRNEAFKPVPAAVRQSAQQLDQRHRMVLSHEGIRTLAHQLVPSNKKPRRPPTGFQSPSLFAI